MARIELAPGVAGDLDRIIAQLEQHEAANVGARITALTDAISVLEHSPLLGRRARRNLRELIVGRGASGYVALYRCIIELDTVFVLAVCSQREAGYADPDI